MTPLRMCAITRQKKPKTELLRLVKVNGKIVLDEKQNIQTRGVYISKDKEALKNLQKSKCLNRAFKTEVPKEVYEEVMNLCSKAS